MKWSILILTLPARYTLLCRLLESLLPQIKQHPDIEIIIRTFDAQKTLGDNRESLRRSASGEYINFIDDDDAVANDYVASIYPRLDGVDYVGFQVQVFADGEQSHLLSYSLTHPKPDIMSPWKDITHLAPMKRSLSLLVEMEGGMGEDTRWADRMRELAVLRTEHHISKPLYFYRYLTRKLETL